MRWTKTLVAGGVMAAVTGLGLGAAAADDGGLFQSRLTGRQEVPKAGDPDGHARGEFEIHRGTLCYELRWRDIAHPTAAHIHRGRAGVPGPVVVDLLAGGRVTAGARRIERCVGVSPAVANALAQNPGRYYVNIHNATYPDGAVRGQLEAN